MREDTIAKLCVRELDAHTLDAETFAAVEKRDAIVSRIHIRDMEQSFPLKREHILRLCEAGITGTISPSSLTTIAFALLASDRFEWDDEIISEVLYDWSAPEINYPLNRETLTMNKEWLTGVAAPLAKPALSPRTGKEQLIFLRTKEHIE